MGGWVLRFGVVVCIFCSLVSGAFAGEKSDSLKYDWSGLYLGAHLGGVRANDTIAGDVTGFAGGILAGYMHQTGNIVYGLEADYYWGDLAKKGQLANLGLTGSNRIMHGGSIRLRAGYAFNDWLVFASSGIAQARSKAQGSNLFFAGKDYKTHYGFVVSGGLEKAVSENWRLRAEYTYADFNARTYHFGPLLSRRLKGANGHGVRLAVSYRFNPARPFQ